MSILLPIFWGAALVLSSYDKNRMKPPLFEAHKICCNNKNALLSNMKAGRFFNVKCF